MTDRKPAPGPYPYGGMTLDRAGLVAASDVVIRRHFRANQLNTPDREELAPVTVDSYDRFAAEVVVAYLKTVNQQPR